MLTEIAGDVIYIDEVAPGHWYRIGDSHTDHQYLDFNVFVRRLINYFPAFMQTSFFSSFNPLIPDPVEGLDIHIDYSDLWRVYYTIQFSDTNQHYKLLALPSSAEEGFEICHYYLEKLESRLKPKLTPELYRDPFNLTLTVLECSDQEKIMPESLRLVLEYMNNER